tara:strand:+ start:403 stop:702 length:300 start_codon:yes stop_codon:yes gene_type:complete
VSQAASAYAKDACVSNHVDSHDITPGILIAVNIGKRGPTSTFVFPRLKQPALGSAPSGANALASFSMATLASGAAASRRRLELMGLPAIGFGSNMMMQR